MPYMCLLCCAMLCYAMLCCAMLCYAMLCYAMLCCALLWLCCAMLRWAMMSCAVLCGLVCADMMLTITKCLVLCHEAGCQRLMCVCVPQSCVSQRNAMACCCCAVRHAVPSTASLSSALLCGCYSAWHAGVQYSVHRPPMLVFGAMTSSHALCFHSLILNASCRFFIYKHSTTYTMAYCFSSGIALTTLPSSSCQTHRHPLDRP